MEHGLVHFARHLAGAGLPPKSCGVQVSISRLRTISKPRPTAPWSHVTSLCAGRTDSGVNAFPMRSVIAALALTAYWCGVHVTGRAKDPFPQRSRFDWRYNLRVNIIGRPSVVMRASRRREGPMGATRCDPALAAGGRQSPARGGRTGGAVLLAGASDSAKTDAGGLSFWLPGIWQPYGCAWRSDGLIQASTSRSDQCSGRQGVYQGGRRRSQRARRCVGRRTDIHLRHAGARRTSFLHDAGAPGQVVGIDAALTGPRQFHFGPRHRHAHHVCRRVLSGALKWNFGVHNTMVYFTGNIPSGTYDRAGWPIQLRLYRNRWRRRLPISIPRPATSSPLSRA